MSKMSLGTNKSPTDRGEGSLVSSKRFEHGH